MEVIIAVKTSYIYSNAVICIFESCTRLPQSSQGSHTSQDEAGTAALKAVELDDRLEGRAVQVRIVQGKEPPHFMAIFGGKMIIFEGGYASSFDGENNCYFKDITELFDVCLYFFLVHV